MVVLCIAENRSLMYLKSRTKNKNAHFFNGIFIYLQVSISVKVGGYTIQFAVRFPNNSASAAQVSLMASAYTVLLSIQI